MKLITSKDINYDKVEELAQVFSCHGLYAVAKEPELGNARVDITFPLIKDDINLNVVVMVWVVPKEPELLRFRVVLIDRKERDKLMKNNELWEGINEIGETLNISAFGFLSPSNMVGITFDYSLTMEGGIAGSTLSNSAKEVARIASIAKSSILREISYVE